MMDACDWSMILAFTVALALGIVALYVGEKL
jgi:hypothetical protein